MTTLREAAQQALEALVKSTGELHRYYSSPTDMQILLNHKAITALKAALEQPEQEPTCPKCKAGVLYECVACSSNNYPTRTSADTKNTPAAAQRKPLTDEQIQTALRLKSCEGYRSLVRRIEAAHGIKEGA